RDSSISTLFPYTTLFRSNKELERLSVHPNSIDLNDYIQHFNVNNTDDIVVGLVTGDISLNQLTSHISRQLELEPEKPEEDFTPRDRKSTRLNSSHDSISY